MNKLKVPCQRPHCYTGPFAMYRCVEGDLCPSCVRIRQQDAAMKAVAEQLEGMFRCVWYPDDLYEYLQPLIGRLRGEAAKGMGVGT